MHNFIDISGVGNSGKTAVSDLLREFDRVWVPADSFEFDFFRLPNGVLDLHHHLVEDWSPIRSHYALKAFIDLTHQLALAPSKLNIWQKLNSTGNAYDKVFNKQFSNQMKLFAKSMTAGSYEAEWPYELASEGPLKKLVHKMAIKFEIKSLSRNQVYLSNGTHFKEKLTEAMNNIYKEVIANDTSEQNMDYVVLHNCFEPFNPVRSLNILSRSRSIIVYRDPRDVYVAGLRNQDMNKKDITFGANDQHGLSESFLATYDIDLFILRYQTYMNNLYAGSDSRILKMRFEDLVTNYDESVKRICQFLDISQQRHLKKQIYFNPEKSKKNIGRWKDYKNLEAIKLISEKLSDFTWNS